MSNSKLVKKGNALGSVMMEVVEEMSVKASVKPKVKTGSKKVVQQPIVSGDGLNVDMLKYFNESAKTSREAAKEESIIRSLKDATLTINQIKALKRANASSYSYKLAPFEWTFLNKLKAQKNNIKFSLHCLMTVPSIVVMIALACRGISYKNAPIAVVSAITFIYALKDAYKYLD